MQQKYISLSPVLVFTVRWIDLNKKKHSDQAEKFFAHCAPAHITRWKNKIPPHTDDPSIAIMYIHLNVSVVRARALGDSPHNNSIKCKYMPDEEVFM